MGLADFFLRYGIRYGSDESLTKLESVTKFIKEVSYEESEKLGKELGVPLQCQKLDKPRRNITTISIAPTGSIAMIGECSHGIEPIFSPSYERVDERGEKYVYTHPQANEDYFVSAVGNNQATWKEQIDLVATAQKYCDSGISKTINLPNSATVSDVKDAMIYAWQSKCKGITIYRDGSRSYQVLTAKPTDDDLLKSTCKDGVCSL
jgi:ribonucleoside-diphosphate reductase alpha chain